MNPIQDSPLHDDSDLEASAIRRRNELNPIPRLRRPEHIRTARPNGFNGKHRRRNKRYSV